MTEADWPPLLIAAARRDAETRVQLAKSGALFRGYHPDMEAVHVENAALLERVIDAIGWPGRAKVGDEAAGAAFMILQHAISRPDLQKRGLDLILDAIAEGQANPLDAAYLSDRIAVFEGREQIFGTQFDWDESGMLSPAPIRNPAEVDERRASVGLPPLADVTAELRARAAVEGDRAPDDHEERRAEFDAWARRVGWRA